MNTFTLKQLIDATWLKMPLEERRRIALCMWATEVLRRKCPVYWL